MKRSVLIGIIIVLIILIIGAGLILFLDGNKPKVFPCLCSEDYMNCNDFDTQSKAQECFDFCSEQGFGDVHRLDNDGDGIVCEVLS